MSYTPINWQTGDTITAEKMNKMDNGWGVQNAQLFSETVTTTQAQFGVEGALSYSGQVSSPTIVVTFNGTDYLCSAIQLEVGGYGYGGVTAGWEYDFSTYPFALVFSPSDGNVLATQTAGAYAVAVSGQGIVISDNFNAAVNECVDTSSMPFRCVSGETTYGEMQSAIVDEGRMLYFTVDLNCYYITNFASNVIHYLPESSTMTVSFVDDVFTVTPI